MRQVRFSDAKRFENSDKCSGWEYELYDPDIDSSIGKIDGRYPNTGYCVNEECKELIYVMDGNGKLVKKDGTIIYFNEKDVILIDKNEEYYWDANCTILMFCTPAWYKEQHKLVD